MTLSVIVPSIRVENLPQLHESIAKSFSGHWEFIVVGPYKPDFCADNMTWIFSKANPTVCQQIGLIEAKGDYVCMAWDDGLFEPNAIDNMFIQMNGGLNTTLINPNVAVCGKYIEGDIAPGYMSSIKYYVINNHASATSPYISNDFLLLNTGLIPRETLMYIGGFDCRFETTALSQLDIAIRLQLYGVKVILSNDVVLKCTWLIDRDGDHGPIFDAFDDDLVLLHKKYRQPIFHKRIIIPMDNWKKQPEIWDKRFKE